jgi:hypothetical protein
MQKEEAQKSIEAAGPAVGLRAVHTSVQKQVGENCKIEKRRYAAEPPDKKVGPSKTFFASGVQRQKERERAHHVKELNAALSGETDHPNPEVTLGSNGVPEEDALFGQNRRVYQQDSENRYTAQRVEVIKALGVCAR